MQQAYTTYFTRLAAAVCLCIGALQLAPDSAWAVSEILQRISQCSKTTSYRGRVEIRRFNGDSTSVRRSVVTFKAPGKAYIERGTEAQPGKVVCRRDGKYYRREPGEAAFVMMDQDYGKSYEAPGYAGINLAAENYHFAKEGLVTVCERPSVILKVEADAQDRPWYRIWVDRETGLILKMEKHNQEQLLFSFVFLEIEINPEIPNSLFNIMVNEVDRKRSYRFFSSVKAMERELGYPLVRPRFIPDGYLRKKCRIIIQEGTRIAHLVFSNGVSALSFFQRCAATDDKLALKIGDTKVTDQQNVTVVRHRTPKYLFTLVGDLDKNQMQRLMQAVQQNAENLAKQ